MPRGSGRPDQLQHGMETGRGRVVRGLPVSGNNQKLPATCSSGPMASTRRMQRVCGKRTKSTGASHGTQNPVFLTITCGSQIGCGKPCKSTGCECMARRSEMEWRAANPNPFARTTDDSQPYHLHPHNPNVHHDWYTALTEQIGRPFAAGVTRRHPRPMRTQTVADSEQSQRETPGDRRKREFLASIQATQPNWNGPQTRSIRIDDFYRLMRQRNGEPWEIDIPLYEAMYNDGVLELDNLTRMRSLGFEELMSEMKSDRVPGPTEHMDALNAELININSRRHFVLTLLGWVRRKWRVVLSWGNQSPTAPNRGMRRGEGW